MSNIAALISSADTGVISGDPYWSDVNLLVKLGDTTTDYSNNGYLTEAYNTITSTPDAEASDGKASLFNSALPNGLVVCSNNLNQRNLLTSILATEPYTIECWIKPYANGNSSIFTFGGSVGQQYPGLNLHLRSDNGFDVEITSVAPSFSYALYSSSIGIVTRSQWSHVAIEGDGLNVHKLYLNGTEVLSIDRTITADTALVNSYPFTIGAYLINPGIPTYAPFNGLIDDFRITINRRRYGSAFTPPTRPLPVG